MSRRGVGNLFVVRQRPGRFGKRGPNGVAVAIGSTRLNGRPTNATPGYAIAMTLREALDPTRAPGKVRTMADMTPEELAKLAPPRRR